MQSHADHPSGKVVHIDTLVDGPPSPFKKEPGPLSAGFDTWNCWTAADPGQFSWWTRGVTMPSPPWQTAWCVLHHFCNSANFFVVRDYESAIIPWP